MVSIPGVSPSVKIVGPVRDVSNKPFLKKYENLNEERVNAKGAQMYPKINVKF